MADANPQTETRVCPTCGAQARTTANRFATPLKCPKCGATGIFKPVAPVPESPPPPPPPPEIRPSKVMAAVPEGKKPIPGRRSQIQIRKPSGPGPDKPAWTQLRKLARIMVPGHGLVLNLLRMALDRVRVFAPGSSPDYVHAAQIFAVMASGDPELRARATTATGEEMAEWFNIFLANWRALREFLPCQATQTARVPQPEHATLLERLYPGADLTWLDAPGAVYLLVLHQLRTRAGLPLLDLDSAPQVISDIWRGAGFYQAPPPSCGNCGAALRRKHTVRREAAVILAAASGMFLLIALVQDAANAKAAIASSVCFLGSLLVTFFTPDFYYRCPTCLSDFPGQVR